MTTYLDTSALAKWYLNELASDRVARFLASTGPVHISDLTKVELRCLLARRRREGDFEAKVESKIFATFEQNVSDGYLIAHRNGPDHFEDAVRLISSLVDHPVRSLDALHLAVMHRENLNRLATADRIMAKAAQAMQFDVEIFN